jgi:hypothetical protein
LETMLPLLRHQELGAKQSTRSGDSRIARGHQPST